MFSIYAAEPRPDFRYRSNANDGKAWLCRVLTRGLAPNKKEQAKPAVFLIIFVFSYEIRPFPPLILLGLSVFVRRNLGRIFAIAQMRTTAKHSFAAYSLEDSLQKENSRSLTCYIFKSYLFFYEIRPFPPSILFVCPCMRGGASAGFSLSLKCERRQSKALPRTHSRTRSKKKTAGLQTCCFLFGAGNEIRTRDICLGKATLYH